MTRDEHAELDGLIRKWPKSAAEQQRYTDLLEKSLDHSGRAMKRWMDRNPLVYLLILIEIGLNYIRDFFSKVWAKK